MVFPMRKLLQAILTPKPNHYRKAKLPVFLKSVAKCMLFHTHSTEIKTIGYEVYDHMFFPNTQSYCAESFTAVAGCWATVSQQ